MRRRVGATTLLCALAVAGCGSGSERTAPPPKLPATIASSLAAHSDTVAQALAAGDSCAALAAAERLQQDAITAINAKRVPAAFQEQLASSVSDLVSRIRCVPPVKQPHDEGKHKGKHRKKHGEGND